MTVAAALARATATLAPDDCARLDAELLLADTLGVARTRLYSDPECGLPDGGAAFFARVEARRSGTPLAYLLGRAEFWSLELEITPAVLVPRPETETLVEAVLAVLPATASANVADLGTGSGAIAAALARERPRCRVVACDRSLAALRVARTNLRRHGLHHVTLLAGDWSAMLATSSLDVLVSNPPYIGRRETGLGRELAFEPADALFAGDGGLAALRAIVDDAPRVLRPGGIIALEHGYRQGRAVRGLLTRAGFARVSTRRDLAGHERVSLAHLD
ncbi:MAG: peptide chain release factor N(5)-glutamine methyltransferase [Gammaproteobacteria bacterium]